MSFKNAIIIMTSNMGSPLILEGMMSKVPDEEVKESVMTLVGLHCGLFHCRQHMLCSALRLIVAAHSSGSRYASVIADIINQQPELL